MEAAFRLLSPSDQTATLSKNMPPPPTPSLFTTSNSTKSHEPSTNGSGPTPAESGPAEDERAGGKPATAEMKGEVEADEMMEKLEDAARLEAEEVGRTKTNEDLMEEEKKVGVQVGQDDLFEVDVKEMKLLPVYWDLRDTLPVQRCLWFYNASTPTTDELAEELEAEYQKAKPWKPSYETSLEKSLLNAKEEATFWHHLPKSERSKSGSFVIFHGVDTAEVVSNRESISSRLSQTLYSQIGGTYSGGTMVFRGYSAATFGRNPRPPKPEENEGVEAPTVSAEGTAGEPPAEQVSDLVLVVHGIGQAFTTTHEAFNSLYDANALRKEVQAQALNANQASLMGSRRVQFLPVQWRSAFRPIKDDVRATEDSTHGFHNHYSLDDVTLQKEIPLVREMMNSVLIDVPFYMSNHRAAMIEAVAVEANRVYRKWVARHPDFEKIGSVHLIGHSLGSALVSDILSMQATLVPPFSTLPKQVIYESKDRFIFNTSCCFLVGSPLALFLHLDQAQIIPRRGRKRTLDAPPDEALDRAGRYGCLSCDSLYNVFNKSDPISYKLGATVDSTLARTKEPLQVASVTTSLLSSVYRSLPSMPSLPNPFSSSGSQADGEKEPKKPFISEIVVPRPASPPGPRKSRAQRLFDRLNPHGALDFYLQSEGLVSSYVDMLSSHTSYWADPDFAAFILSEICTKDENLETMREGVQ